MKSESYGQLLAKYQPKAITTESENEQAIALAQELEHRNNRTLEEDALLELLVTLIEKFEETYYPIPPRYRSFNATTLDGSTRLVAKRISWSHWFTGGCLENN
jgi:hypothetical protein